MKTCTRCGLAKALDQFPYLRQKKRHEARCKTCVHSRQARWLRERRAGTDKTLPPDTNELVRAQRDEIMGRIAANVVENPVTGCLEWTTAKSRQGYGFLFVRLHNQWHQFGAHRLVACLFHGLDLLDRHRLACHHCDNRSCVSQSHIFSGSHEDNQQDAIRKGRMKGHPRISDATVAEIRQHFAAGVLIKDLASRFGIHRLYAGRIVRGKARM